MRDTVKPVAVLGATPVSGDAPLTVSFNGGASSDEWGIALYQWNFGEGSGIQTGATPGYTYANAGAYGDALTVRDNSGLSNQTTRQISVNDPANEPPTAPRARVAPGGCGAVPGTVRGDG